MNHLIQLVTAEEGGGGGNFLVPNMTFVFELVSFAIIMYVMYKWVLPPINKAMTERQEKIKASSRRPPRPSPTPRAPSPS